MLRRRGSKWTVRIYDPRSPGRQRWVGSYDSKREALGAERKALSTVASTSGPRTVRDWTAIWEHDYQRPARATQKTYHYAACQIVEDIGDLKMTQVDRPTARRWANQWPRGTTRVARAMFGDAHRDGLILANPFSNMRLETSKGRKDLDALTEKEIAGLADAALALGEYGPEFRAIIIFLGYVGCRPGELACIRRADLDPADAEVTIRFALDGEGGEKAPKNGKPRVVTVPPPALQALAQVPPRLDSQYLFHTATGKRLSKGSFSYAFRVVRQRWAGREKLEPYELRHAAATILMHRGLPPHVVANQLGHTDGGALVQRLYGHPEEARMRDQVRMAFAGWGAPGEQSAHDQPANRRVS